MGYGHDGVIFGRHGFLTSSVTAILITLKKTRTICVVVLEVERFLIKVKFKMMILI